VNKLREHSLDDNTLIMFTSDNGEAKNLISEQPERAAAMRSKLEAWTNQFNPPGIPAKLLNDQETKWYEHYFNLR